MSGKSVPKEPQIEKILEKLSPEAKTAVKALIDKGCSNSSYIFYSLETMKKRTLQENGLADEISTPYEDKYTDKENYSDSGNYSDKNYSDTHYGDRGPYNDNYKDIIASLKSDNVIASVTSDNDSSDHSSDNDRSNSTTKFKP